MLTINIKLITSNAIRQACLAILGAELLLSVNRATRVATNLGSTCAHGTQARTAIHRKNASLASRKNPSENAL